MTIERWTVPIKDNRDGTYLITLSGIQPPLRTGDTLRVDFENHRVKVERWTPVIQSLLYEPLADAQARSRLLRELDE